ncbi:aldo/keto reductase [Haloferax volcanii]|uniref:2,5-diketo-D-gluconic acid reductase B n=3 Tax=Haloferax volcanii TaxID=2246 RepID=A0A384LG23_HALVD|nr:aldo/keto reductase [Haloferax volcanii]ADE04922.1 putative oxidoreductase (aldo-keto reductase family protein) [Haloferax volcanii DS2]ELY33457.1 2,5-diketo-D-gluconic acid reductase B [Haloferax volcanii DS2]MBS8119149.1 aldo/keto reductase [Haloferax volcanii]MBS8124162.1 aldo/keto reductase [Haloferax volcanii]MBS8128031.1 aldo/keto reductase [Haloferax volcanii]
MTASLPRIGLGTMGLDTPDEAAAVTTALELGYRHVDTAQIYGNEAVVGDALAAADVPREDVTLATRVWADSLAPADVRRTTRESLEKLGTDSVDLLYVHRPIDTYDPEATLAAFDELVDDGLARGVGVSNFTAAELDEALDLLDAPLVAHQTEYHPLFQRSELLDHAEERGYDVVAYSPLSGGRVRDVDEVVAVAEKHDATPEAVSLAWLAAKGLCPIPKASSERHLRANLDAVSLELDAADVAAIDSIESEVELFPE